MEGRPYEVRSNLWASTYSLVADDGSVVATASRVGRKDWTVEAGSATHTFRRVSPWRHEEELHVGGQRVGSIKRTSIWGGEAVADLPGLPPAVAIFAFAVVLTSWDLAASRRDATGAGPGRHARTSHRIHHIVGPASIIAAICPWKP